MDNGLTIKHLWECSKQLNTSTHTNKLLKSYYMCVSRNIAGINSELGKEKFSSSHMCPKCMLFWSESDFEMKLRPQQIVKTRKTEKLIKRLEENSGVLSKKQRKRAKWLQKKVSSFAEIHCGFCNNICKMSLEKPTKRKYSKKNLPPFKENMLTENKKHKKKKDKTVGLNIPLKRQEEEKHKDRANRGQINKAPLDPKKCQESLKPTLNVTNSKKKKIVKPATVPKVQSRTQQKNSILQLAALLKNQGTNKIKSKLECLLK